MPTKRNWAALARAFPTAPLGLVVVVAYLLLQRCTDDPLDPQLVKQESIRTRRGLFSTTRLTDLVAETRSALAVQSSFVGARVTRTYTHVEHIDRSILGIPSDATALVSYSAEFSFGYVLSPRDFTVTGERGGIVVTLRRPRLVASPGVRLVSHSITDRGLFIDEEAAVIELQQEIQGTAQRRAVSIQAEPAVVAACERALANFLRTMLARHGPLPRISFIYR